jgi:excisionase family DNA binding protein
MLNHLLVRPEQFVHESRHGYLLRLANANGLAKYSWLSSVLSEAAKHRGPWAVCVRCLSETKGVWERAWCNTRFPYCEQHGVQLTDACTVCGAKFTASRVEFSQCACGTKFADMSSLPMSKNLSDVLGERLVEDRHTLLWLGAVSVHGFTGKPLKRASTKALSERAGLMEEGARIALNWPVAFERVLDLQRVTSPLGQVQLMHSAWPRLTNLMALLRESQWREAVRRVVEGHVTKSRQSGAPLITRSPVVQTRAAGLAQLANRAGVKFERLRLALDDQTGAVEPRRTKAGRVRRCPSARNLEQATFSLKDKLALRPAAKRAGLSVPRLREVCGAGYLSMSSGKISASALSGFLEGQRQFLLQSNATNGMSYADFLRFHVPLKQTAIFVSFILTGEVPIQALARSSPPTDWWISADAVERAIGLLKAQEPVDFTISEAAVRLGLKEQVAYQLAAAGLLRVRSVHTSGTRGRRVSREEVDAFPNRLTPLSDVARQAGLPIKAARHWLSSVDLELACGPGIDGVRQYFVFADSAKRYLNQHESAST